MMKNPPVITDETVRARFVEVLRASANMLLDGLNGRIAGEDPSDEVVRVRVGYRLHRELLEGAAALCDHARVTGSRCRYCEAVVIEGQV